MKTKCPLPKGFSGTRRVSGIFVSLLALSLASVSAAVAAPFAYVPNPGSNTVSVIDGTTVFTTVPVGARPSTLAVNPAGTRAYVFNQAAGTISVIDVSTNTVVGTPIVVGPPIPADMAFGPGGVAVSDEYMRVYVANGANGTAVMIDLASNVVTPIPTTAGPGTQPKLNGVVVVGTRAYFSDLEGHVIVIDGTSQIATITVGTEFSSRPTGIVASPSGNRVYVVDLNNFISTVLEVSVIDPAVMAVVATIPIEEDTTSTPGGVAVSPDGNLLYVTNDMQDRVSVVSLVAPAVCLMPNQSPPCVVTDVGVGGLPFGVATDPSGTRVYVVNWGSGTVSVIDSGSNAVLSTVLVGSSPSVLGAFVTAGVTPPPPPPAPTNPPPTDPPPPCDASIAELQKKVSGWGYYRHNHGYSKLKAALRMRAAAVREIEKAKEKVAASDKRIVNAKKELGRGDVALCANRYWRAEHEYWEAYEISRRVLKQYWLRRR